MFQKHLTNITNNDLLTTWLNVHMAWGWCYLPEASALPSLVAIGIVEMQIEVF